MVIQITAEKVSKKARAGAEQMENIQDTIDDILPTIITKLREEYLNTTDADTLKIIELGATEIVVGEFLKEYANDEEDSTDLSIGPVKIGDNKAAQSRGKRAAEWISDGWSRLKPYLKPSDYFYFGAG